MAIPQEKQLPPPDSGFYKCCVCGTTAPIINKDDYENESACPDESCFGQMFCNDWGGWLKNPVVKMADYDYRGVTWSVEDMLAYHLEVEPERNHPKAVLLFLNDTNGKYAISKGSAGFAKMTEIIAFLECAKVQIIAEDMNLIGPTAEPVA